MLLEAWEDMGASRIIYNDFTARAFEKCKAEYLTICAIVDCIRKSYKKVRE
jgi:hypothetical protein